jgi:hypothetical protein
MRWLIVAALLVGACATTDPKKIYDSQIDDPLCLAIASAAIDLAPGGSPEAAQHQERLAFWEASYARAETRVQIRETGKAIALKQMMDNRAHSTKERWAEQTAGLTAICDAKRLLVPKGSSAKSGGR